jgi:hypothetical protein
MAWASQIDPRRFELASTHRLAIQHQNEVIRFLQTLAGLLFIPPPYRN